MLYRLRQLHNQLAKFRKKDMRRGRGEAGSGGQQRAADGQRRGAGGAEPTGSLRAFLRYPPQDVVEV